MKQLISVLVAAMFAAASVTVVAQDKKADTKMEKSGQMDKKDTKKKSTKKPTKKKGEGKKKAEEKKP
jgi:Ni/Co efflux regulator RcnB